MFFRRQGRLPYVHGYAAFSLILWLACAVGLVHSFGWIWGIAGLVFTITILQYVTHFTLGIIWNFAIRERCEIALAGFSVMVWVTVGLGIAQVIWGERHV
jgi:hypothetical protein